MGVKQPSYSVNEKTRPTTILSHDRISMDLRERFLGFTGIRSVQTKNTVGFASSRASKLFFRVEIDPVLRTLGSDSVGVQLRRYLSSDDFFFNRIAQPSCVDAFIGPSHAFEFCISLAFSESHPLDGASTGAPPRRAC